MQKFSKPILIAIVSSVGFCALALLGANLYLHSKEVPIRIQDAASRAAGVPLRIQGTSFTPWSGVSVSGITVSQNGSKATPFLDVSSVSVGLRFLPLLSGKIVISDVLLTNPLITSVQRADGTWEQPQRYKAPDASSTPASAATSIGAVPNDVPPSEAKLSDTEAEIKVPQTTYTKPSPPRPPLDIERLRIRNGRALFYDNKGNVSMALEEISVNARVPAQGPANGSFKIRKMTFVGALHPNDMSGHFSWANGKLDIPDLVAKWADGTLAGSFHLDPLPANRFAATIAADNVSLKKLAEDAGMAGEGKKGTLFLKGQLAGTPGQTDSFAGIAELHLQNARLQPLDFIRQIGDLLQIEELQMLQLKTAVAAFTIRDSKVIADSIVIQSENLVIDADGPTSFEGKLKLKARLHINEKLRKDSHGLIGNNFEKSDREGYTQMPFTITGTLSRPKTDLLDKLVGARIGQDFGGLLKSFFRPAPAKTPPESETPAPAGGQDGK